MVGTIKNIIQGQVQEMLKMHHSTSEDSKYLTSNTGVLFTVHVRCSNYGYELDGETNHPEWIKHVGFYITYIVTRQGKVFESVSDEAPLFQPNTNPKSFKLTADHYYCWKDDGFRSIFDKMVEAYTQAYENTPFEHRPPGMISGNVDVNLLWFVGKPMFRYVLVDYARTPLSSEFNCHRESIDLISWKPLKVTTILEE